MRFVPVKSVEQQDLQHLHRISSQAGAQRTVLANQILGFPLECGVVIAQGLGSLRRRLPEIARRPAPAVAQFEFRKVIFGESGFRGASGRCEWVHARFCSM